MHQQAASPRIDDGICNFCHFFNKFAGLAGAVVERHSACHRQGGSSGGNIRDYPGAGTHG